MSTGKNATESAKKKITIRDIMTIAAMMVLTLIVSGVTGPLTLPVPFLISVCMRWPANVLVCNLLSRCCKPPE